MKKNIAKLLLCTVCVLSISAPAYAKEMHNQAAAETQISTRAHDMEYKLEYVDSTTETYDLGAAGGQPRDGSRFDSPGGYFYWEDGGSSVTFSVSLYGGPVSINVSKGEIANRVTQYGQAAPANCDCKLGVEKTVKVTKYKIMKRLQGSKGAWAFDGYTTKTEIVHYRFYIIYC